MKKSILAMTLLAGALLITSCASKKDLQNCQLENKDLTSNLQNTKEQLAASNLTQDCSSRLTRASQT